MTHKSLAVKVHCAPAADVPPPPTTHTVDFGSNLAGVCRLKGIVGPAGSRVTIRHGEALQHAHLPGLEFPDPDRIYTDNLRTAKATDTYVMKGAAGGESWQPTMTYHGFRYVEVTGPSTLTADNIVRWRCVLDLSRFNVSLTGLGHSLVAGTAALSLGRGAADECELLLADAEPAAEDGSRRSEEQYDE